MAFDWKLRACFIQAMKQHANDKEVPGVARRGRWRLQYIMDEYVLLKNGVGSAVEDTRRLVIRIGNDAFLKWMEVERKRGLCAYMAKIKLYIDSVI